MQLSFNKNKLLVLKMKLNFIIFVKMYIRRGFHKNIPKNFIQSNKSSEKFLSTGNI